MDTVKLTQYSHGGGCGCKISPAILDTILKSNSHAPVNKRLLVGNSSKDDAAVYDLDNGMALISTTDFFMPIVDDPFAFGRIASANAISDVYAMGGKPVLAIAILGWPVNVLSPDIAQQVLEGARQICAEAGIPLAGGHSIDSPEPIFGLAVNGLVAIDNLKQNNTAKEGDLLFLTKPLGVGILTTAQKRSLLKDEYLAPLLKQLGTLNNVGEALGNVEGVHAMTDVTGFGLLGHLIEMADGSGISAHVRYASIPIIEAAKELAAQKVGPGATPRNWDSYGGKVLFAPEVNTTQALSILPDPQTNGGLLIAVDPAAKEEVQKILSQYGLTDFAEPIGVMKAREEKTVTVGL